MNVLSIAQAMNTALSFFVLCFVSYISSMYSVCECSVQLPSVPATVVCMLPHSDPPSIIGPRLHMHITHDMPSYPVHCMVHIVLKNSIHTRTHTRAHVHAHTHTQSYTEDIVLLLAIT